MNGEVARTVLDRLRGAATSARDAWPDISWQCEPEGEGAVVLGQGFFRGLALRPGVQLELVAPLEVPERLQGVALAGEPLEVAVNTLYPVEVAWNGRAVLDGEAERVAPGPSLVQLVPALEAGNGGMLRIRVFVPDQQTWPWLQVRLTTPGIRRRHQALDLAWARLALAHEVAAGDAERQLVESAAGLVPGSLEDLDGPALEEALTPSAVALAPLAERAGRIGVHVIGHSHIDMNWLWSWPDTLEVIKRDLRTVVRLMDEFSELTFTHSQAATYEAFRREDPATFARITELVASGRWEVATMQWVESDLNIPSGEALARQLLEGVRYARQRLGASPTTFLAPDTFGHTQNLPQLAVSAGAQRYYHMRCNPGHPDPWPVYWWEGVDGSRLLVTSTASYNGEISAGQIAAAAIDAHRHGLAAGLFFHGIGDHGGGPTRQGIELLRDLQGQEGMPRVCCSTLAAYTDEVLAAGPALPIHHGELGFVFEGCYTTHGDAKLRNRKGENALTTADTLCALAGIDGGEALQEAWRLVLFNQFHDILCGSSIHEAYDKSAEDGERALGAAREITDHALDLLWRGVPEDGIAVTNPLGWEREDAVMVEAVDEPAPLWVEGEDGAVIPAQPTEEGLLFVARLRPFSTQGFRLRRDGPEPGGLSCQEDEQTVTVETPFFSVHVDRPSGAICSLLDRRVGRQLVGHPATRATRGDARRDLALGVLQLLDEHHHGMAAWQLEQVYRESSLISGGTTSVVESGPVRVVLATTHRVRQSSIVQHVMLYRSLPRIDFETAIEWGEPVGPEVGFTDLKVAFSAHLEEAEAWYETAFGAVRRPADGAEVPALRWADVGGERYGIAVLNDCKHGHDALGCRLRLTLVHGSDNPDPLADIGRHRVRYSLVPHPGGWREALIPQQALGFNQPCLAGRGRGGTPWAAPAWSAGLEGAASVLMASVKQAAEGGGVVVRLYESAGRTGEVRLPVPRGARAFEVSAVEDRREQLAPQDGRIHLTFRPWHVRNILLERTVDL